MNGLGLNRLDVNTAGYDSAFNRKKVVAVSVLEGTTETDKEKYSKDKKDNSFDLSQANPALYTRQEMSDGKYYRTHLLNEIINKMNGVEPRFYPGHFVEYFA